MNRDRITFKSLLLSISIFLVCISTLGCAPHSWKMAQRAHESGDIVAAVKYSVQSLKEKPGYEDAIDFLSSQLPRFYDDLYARAQRAERANDWDEAFILYDNILTISDAVRSLPPQTHPKTKYAVSFSTRDVETERLSARTNAAEKHYESGLSFESQGRSKDAAKAFSRALSYISNFKDAPTRYEKNRQAAVKRIAVMPFENLSGKEYFGAIGAVIADLLITEVMADPRNLEFMEFVTREKITEILREQRFTQTDMVDPKTAAEIGKILGIDAFVFGKVTSIVTDYPPDVVSTFEEKNEISQGKDKPKRKVAATVTIISRKANARLTCSYQIVDVARGSIVKSGVAPWVEAVEITFGRYKGDKEALSYRTRELCNRRESYPPPEDELVNRAAENSARDLAQQIAAFFR